jgi:hypothetical protein
MPLSWNEIKSRAMAFSKRWADAGNDEGEADLTKHQGVLAELLKSALKTCGSDGDG